ncbi:RNA polymerase subunit sigma [Streptomyces caeruleatus]|uniref:RNA polymerase subunit sigma n=1 Tax=Streptomyces caeruleatus TaxID=661399 RepID=A0A101U9L2_9ACTN|nr:RNA polymerase subunit sigma [Streptomyces caeruleatus]KUO06570.1 RNA polymerase subunit sigma [Streptomyces caeruleatus]
MASANDAVPIAELLDERRHLLDVAYWMLGSGRAAEGVVDETYRRWFELPEAERARTTAPRSWLAKAAGGICLSRLTPPGRARARAVRTEPGGAVPQGMRAEEISTVLLDALDARDSPAPAERAAFVLDDVFGMAPHAVADIVRRTEPRCVEPADRARRSLRARRARPTPAERHDEVVRAVRQACVTEDEALLASLLAADATAFFDGGGKVRALIEPVRGDIEVARSLLTLLARRPRTTVDTHPVNGRTGLVVRYGRQVAAVVGLDVAGPRVVQVWVTLNPDKLRTWNRPGPAQP